MILARPARALLAGALALAPLPAAAQELLKESDLRIVTAMVRAEIDGLRAGTRAAEGASVEAWQREQAARERLAADVKAGRVDPLAWLREHATTVAVPPGFRYDAACSRGATEQSAMTGSATAVFTSGIAAGGTIDRIRAGDPKVKAALEGSKSVSDQERLQIIFGTNDQASAGVATKASAYYRARADLEYVGFNDLMQAWQFASRNRAADSLRIAVHKFNNVATVEACHALPSGPLVSISVETKRDELTRALDAEEARLGTIGDRNTWAFIQSAVDQARRDIEDGEELAAWERSANDTEREQAATRRRNVQWYRRHAATLDPLYAELERAQAAAR